MATLTLRHIHEALKKINDGTGLGDMLKSDNLAGLTNLPLARANLGVSAGAAYVHPQAIASTTWTVDHNLGFKPDVELFNAAGDVFIGQVNHPSVNQAIVTLVVSTAGEARCT